MNSGNRHFSHAHNLFIHQADEAAKMSCFGCNSSVSGSTIYVCWQCNFALHEQCFRATRSLTHPSHSSHPLTLVPYPTYPSNFFYCNLCKLMGTGFSYSCSHCEFDIHVHCAHYYIKQNVIVPTSAQHSNMMHAQHGGFVSTQTSNHNPTTNPQYSSMVPNTRVEECCSSSVSDLELLKLDLQRLKIEKEEVQLVAKSRKEFLEFLYQL